MPVAVFSEQQPKKRIAIFLDGTWNEVSDNTNVWRLKSLCATQGADGLKQLIYYDAGVGTQRGEKVSGGALGLGLERNVTEAYEWLIDNYQSGDDIFIFGFSRGAYTARSLAGFITKCGLLVPGAALGVGQLYDRYRRASEPRTVFELHAQQAENKLGECTLEETWMLKDALRVPIKVVGVWDTVGALGIPFLNIEGLSSSRFGFLHTGLRRPMENCFHALAVDEHRQKFAPTLWTVNTHKGPNAPAKPPVRPISSVEQRWFVGAHANVGGGYRSDLLAQTSLRWMMLKASIHGLTFRSELVQDGKETTSPIADSYAEFTGGLYKYIKPRHFRPIGEKPKETDALTTSNVNETIDGSVFQRWRADSKYRPRNLDEWAHRHKVDPSSLTTSVRADDPKVVVPD